MMINLITYIEIYIKINKEEDILMYLIYSNEVYDDWTIVGVMETKDESEKI